MAGQEEYRRGTALGEDYREVNNRRGRDGQGGGEDYREVTREKMRFLRTLTVSCNSFFSLSFHFVCQHTAQNVLRVGVKPISLDGFLLRDFC